MEVTPPATTAGSLPDEDVSQRFLEKEPQPTIESVKHGRNPEQSVRPDVGQEPRLQAGFSFARDKADIDVVGSRNKVADQAAQKA